jgi:hypothetical protein
MILAGVDPLGRQPGAPLDGHLWHLLTAAGFIVVALLGVWVGETVTARRPAPARAGATVGGQVMTIGRSSGAGLSLLPFVVIASAAAAAVHYVVMPEHFEESTLYGTFFATAATVQVAWAAYLAWRPSAPALLTGAAGNLILVGLWLYTRVVEIPLGPGAGHTEGFGGLDVVCSSFEFVMAAAAIVLVVRSGSLRSRIAAAPPTRWPAWAWVAVAGAAAVVVVTAILSPPS